MAAILSVRQICERALRKIGHVSLYDEEPRGEDMEEAALWLDMVVSHVAGTRRHVWLVEDNLEIPLKADQAKYDLKDAAGATYPEEGVQFPMHAFVRSDGGFDQDVEIVRRHEYDSFADKDAGGRPHVCYIDRLQPRTLWIHPVPAKDDEYTLFLTAQRFNKDMTFTRQEQRHGEKYPDPSATWNLYLVTATAAELGDGPIRKLPDGEVTSFRRHAERLLGDLESFEDQEHADETERRINFHDF